MYPQRELIRLAAYKAGLQGRIAQHRAACAAAAARAAQPVAWLDRAMEVWRKFAPFVPLAAVPLGLIGARKLFPRLKTLGMLLRWTPLVFGAVRGFKSIVTERR
jgi:hypothetical protein